MVFVSTLTTMLLFRVQWFFEEEFFYNDDPSLPVFKCSNMSSGYLSEDQEESDLESGR